MLGSVRVVRVQECKYNNTGESAEVGGMWVLCVWYVCMCVVCVYVGGVCGCGCGSMYKDEGMCAMHTYMCVMNKIGSNSNVQDDSSHSHWHLGSGLSHSPLVVHTSSPSPSNITRHQSHSTSNTAPKP